LFRGGGAAGIEAVGELEDGVGGAERGVVGAIAELFVEDVGGEDEKLAKGVGGGGPDFVAAAEVGFEEGIFVFPAVESSAIDSDSTANVGVFKALDEKFDGHELAGGEVCG